MKIESVIEEKKKFTGLYCTGCNYCMPCPNNVNIPTNFSIMNLHRVYGATTHAKRRYAYRDRMKVSARFCIKCGICEEKCPQKIKIMNQLKETHRVLGSIND